MSRVPRIRFKGFEEDWEQRKLGEVANRFDSTRIPISENLRVSGKTPYYGANGIQDYVDGYTHDGEYVLIAEDGANDLKNYPIRLVKGRIWVNNHAHVIQGMEKFMNNQFINFAMSQVDFESIVVGCGRAKLNAEQLMDICFKIPNKNEQANIGRLFESINHLITLHQRKLEKLKIIKKSMLENLFPQNGEKTPKIRFSGFTEDWEQRKLGEVAIFSKGVGYSKSDLKDSGIPIILYGRLYTNYEIVIKDVDTFADGICGAVYSKGGEIITPSSGETSEDISIASVVKKSGVLLGGDLNIIYPQSFLNPIFIAISISNGKPHKEMAKRAQGKSVVHLHNVDLSKIEIDYPSIDEQTRISSYFISLDHLITLHQSKLDKLQKIKKSMLESMFV